MLLYFHNVEGRYVKDVLCKETGSGRMKAINISSFLLTHRLPKNISIV